MPTPDILWGGQLKAVGFDPVVHSLTLQVDVFDGSASAIYYLVCSGVSGLRYKNTIPDPWTYAEVTEVHTSQTTAEQWTVEVVMWSEDCELVCTCDAFAVIEHSRRD